MNKWTMTRGILRFRRGNANLPLIIGGVVVAALLAVGIWFVSANAGGKEAPKGAQTPVTNPQQEAANQAEGEKNLGNGGSGTGGDVGDGGSSAASQAAGERNLGNR